jgi:serine/threonine protein phosphatase PrpC
VADRRDHIEVSISQDFEGVTDRGLRHYRNEDALAMDIVDGAQIIVVCDGVSSTEGAEKASEAAAEAAFRALAQRSSLSAAIAKASTAVIASGTAATTIIAAVVKADTIELAWLGDSRAYWIPVEGSGRQLTEDHTESPDSHVITRWLGVDAQDEAATTRFPIEANGHLLVCTDGLWNYLPDPTEMIQNGANARDLVAYANDQGGHDNITAALLHIAYPSTAQ